MTELVEIIAKAIVDNPEGIKISQRVEEDGTEVIDLNVAPEDMGKVIGKKGRIAKSIRQVVRAAAMKSNRQVVLNIVDEDEMG